MWQGKIDDDTRVAFTAETEGKMRIPEDTFEDPDITLKAFRDMLNGEERPSNNKLLIEEDKMMIDLKSPSNQNRAYTCITSEHERKEMAKKYREENNEMIIEHRKNYRETNKGKIIERREAYRRKKKD